MSGAVTTEPSGRGRVGESPSAAAEALLLAVLAEIPCAGGAMLLMQPATGLFWTGAVSGLPAASCHPFFTTELTSASPRTFGRLAATGAGATALSRHARSLGDDPFGCTVLDTFGYTDELRVVCRDGGTAWAGLSLWRRDGTFSAAEEARLDAAAPAIGRAVRSTVVAALTAPGGPDRRAVLVVEDGRVVERSRDGADLFAELEQPELEEYRHVDHLAALAAVDPSFSTVLCMADGGWITAHATELSPGRVAISLGTATPADLLGARVAAAGLTPREAEVTRLLCCGLSEREIARRLGVSGHTVHDHGRAVRRKLGVSSRAEVVARVFTDRYFDGFLETAAVSHAED